MAVAGIGKGFKGMQPSTFASTPMDPAGPSTPKDEFGWMIEGEQAKGFEPGAEPTKVDFKRALDSLKGFFRKGQKIMDLAEASNAANKEDPNWKNPGFEGWPQPFWWTRPPAWLDDVPGWMQRLEMKRASNMHRAAAFN